MACSSYIESDLGRTKIVTSASRPTGALRYTGQRIFESDTGRELMYDGAGWVIMSEPAQTWNPTFASGVTVGNGTWGAGSAAEAPASRCEARPPGTQVLTSGVGAAVELTAENTDTGGFHDNSTNNTRLTAPYSGVYFVSYTMDIAAQAGGDRSFWFAKNGGSVRYAATNAIGTTARHEMCGSCDIELDAGDYVELIAYQSSGVSLFTGTQSWCAVQIRYVSAV